MCPLAGRLIVCVGRRNSPLARERLKIYRRPTLNKTDTEAEARTVLSRSYLASLPERTVRAGAALTGGLAYEASEVVLPLAVRRSRLYQAIVGRLLRITIELVGGVEGVYPGQEMPARELLVRKTAGNAVELSSFLAVGWSALWLLAGASDLVGGTKAYLRALTTGLRDGGGRRQLGRL